LGRLYEGDTQGFSAYSNRYGCKPNLNEDGPETVYVVTTTFAMTITARLTYTDPADLDLFILNDPHPASCVGWGDSEARIVDLPPGRYFIVVDSSASHAGPYTLIVYGAYRIYAPLSLRGYGEESLGSYRSGGW